MRTKYGTKDELLAAVRELREKGVAVYVDAVLNHKAGADFTEPTMVKEVAQDDRNKEVSDQYEIEVGSLGPLEGVELTLDGQAWTGFNFPGRKGKYSKMEWQSVPSLLRSTFPSADPS